ncbi:MAG: DUF3237 domain-containing protein [Firmicutes bacterium]|nr:DUF3237 domain-containing protein [Bacillota bacterium]
MTLTELFRYEIVQTEDVEMPGTGAGDLLLSPTSGGWFEGERLRGKLLPLGMGTCLTRGEENDIESQILLRTDDGENILMTTSAWFDVPQEIEDRLIAGEPVDPGAYYYKGTVAFQTGSPAYKWLERKVCVCECTVHDYTRLTFTVYMIQ